MEEQTEFNDLSREEKRRKLYLEQVKLLDTFLAKGAITKQQYDKSYGDLTVKMGFGEAPKA